MNPFYERRVQLEKETILHSIAKATAPRQVSKYFFRILYCRLSFQLFHSSLSKSTVKLYFYGGLANSGVWHPA